MEIISDSNEIINHDSINLNSPKIILITSRIRENFNYKPAEEILLEILANKTGLKFEIIESDLYQTNNFFGRSPVIYFNGKVIANKNILNFLKDLLLNDHNLNSEKLNPENNSDDQRKNLFFENLISILRDQLRFANEYFYFLKLKEKNEKFQNRKIFLSFFSNLFTIKINNSAYEQISENVLNSFSVVSNPQNLYSNFDYKLSILIKDAYAKLNKLIRYKEFNGTQFHPIEQNFYDFLIFSFLKEDKLLFTQSEISRPFMNYLNNEEEENFSQIAAYFNKIEEKIQNNSNILNIYKISPSFSHYANNYSLAINPSHKKVKNIQEMEVTRSLYHNLFSIGIFTITALILFYVSTRRNN